MGYKKLDKTLNTDMGLQIGKIDAMLEELYEAPGAPGTDFSDLVVEAADATGDNAAVINEIKTNFNALVARLSGGA